ncbi:MAG: glycosyl hydrolase family 28 protein [Terriglobia bacterium]
MDSRCLLRIRPGVMAGLIALFFMAVAEAASGPAVYNVRDFGATGMKKDNALPAIQKAIDTCAASGGGMVYLPPGEYTSGQIRLKSHVRFYVEAGATIYATMDPTAFEKSHWGALLYGQDLENISIEGRGTLDGQSEYIWHLDDIDDAYIRENSLLMKSLGKPLMRAFPKGNPNESSYPRLVLLVRCKDVRISGLSFIRSRSWNINPYACERMVIDGIYVHSSLKEGVWADGIDPDGCKDLRISNSTIETGDDALVFYSSNAFGPPMACENITVTNCRFSSASSAIKFCDGNMVAVRKVTIDNCVITSSNRGLAFMMFNKGYVSDVILSNLTVETIPFDWFWWGDADPIHFNIMRGSELDPRQPREKDPPVGSIRNVLLKNIIAHGRGTSKINGHPESWLEGVRLENIRLFLSSDPTAYGQKAVHAMKFRWAKDLKLKDVEVIWDKPESTKWESALYLEDVKGLQIDEFTGRQAKLDSETPAVVLNQVEDALIRDSAPREGTRVFLSVQGNKSNGILLMNNDLRKVKVPFNVSNGANRGAVQLLNNSGSAN